MPSPRAGRGREMTAVAPVQIDDQRKAEADLQRKHYDRTLGRARPRAVEIRNGLPFRPYVYRGTGTDQMENADA